MATANLPLLAGFWIRAKRHPLDLNVVSASAPCGTSIREVLGCESNNFWVALDDERLPPELWATMRPSAGQTVFLCQIPKNDNVKMLLLTAGLIATAVFGGGAIVTALSKGLATGVQVGGLFGQQAFWTSAIMGSGSLAMTALVKPPVVDA